MLTLITAPTVEPVTLSEARAHAKIDDVTTGEPAPTAPSVALAGAGAGNVDDGAHRYRVTFVTADGETDGGAISDAVTVADKSVNGRVSVSGIPTGGSAVTARKLYRTAAGGTTYLLLTTIADNATTTYADTLADATLGASCPSTNTTADPELTRQVRAARMFVERATRRSLLTQTWELWLRGFPWHSCGQIELPFAPLQSVTSITYKDAIGAWQTLPTASYLVAAPAGPAAERGYVTLAAGYNWPTTYAEADVVKVRFVSGYGATAASVPEDLRMAVLLKLAEFYEDRSGQTKRGEAFDALIWPYRSLRW